MVSLKDIPAEVRWEIATKSANSQSVVYDMLVRQIIGDRIDEIWNIIMSQGGKESKAVAERPTLGEKDRRSWPSRLDRPESWPTSSAGALFGESGPRCTSGTRTPCVG